MIYESTRYLFIVVFTYEKYLFIRIFEGFCKRYHATDNEEQAIIIHTINDFCINLSNDYI